MQGSRTLIGDRVATSFWMANWTGEGPLRAHISGPLHREEDGLCVRECWDQNHWIFDKIFFVLPANLILQIQKTNVQWFSPRPDHIIWNHSSNGEFTSRSSCIILQDTPSTSSFTDWSWIWKLPCNPRVKHFFWHGLELWHFHEILMTILIFFSLIITSLQFASNSPNLF